MASKGKCHVEFYLLMRKSWKCESPWIKFQESWAEQGLLDEALYSSFFCTRPLPSRIILIIISTSHLIGFCTHPLFLQRSSPSHLIITILYHRIMLPFHLLLFDKKFIFCPKYPCLTISSSSRLEPNTTRLSMFGTGRTTSRYVMKLYNDDDNGMRGWWWNNNMNETTMMDPDERAEIMPVSGH